MRNWARYEEAKRLRDTGMTLMEVGASMGISATRVRDMLASLQRKKESDAAMADKSPKWWDGLDYQTTRRLNESGMHCRDDCKVLLSDDLKMWRGMVLVPGLEEDEIRKWAGTNRLSLKVVNKVRLWLGGVEFTPSPRVATDAEISAAKRLLERNGWTVSK